MYNLQKKIIGVHNILCELNPNKKEFSQMKNFHALLAPGNDIGPKMEKVLTQPGKALDVSLQKTTLFHLNTQSPAYDSEPIFSITKAAKCIGVFYVTLRNWKKKVK